MLDEETNESESDTDSRNGTTNEETILPNTTEQPEIEYSLEEVDPTPIPTLIIATEAENNNILPPLKDTTVVFLSISAINDEKKQKMIKIQVYQESFRKWLASQKL